MRDVNTGPAEFRKASDQLAHLLCADTFAKLTQGQLNIQTPNAPTTGVPMPDDVMVVPIMRAALSLMPAFIQMLPDTPVGMIGIERNENTAKAFAYYQKLPNKLPGRAIILDPMLATGGSACLAVDILVEKGYRPENIYFTGVIAAQEGFDILAKMIPVAHITVAVIDPDLNDKKYIVPGLGDYGDRYYGT